MVLIILKQGHIFAFSDGTEIAASTLMEILLKNDFKLVIDKITYDVQCPKKGKKHSCELSSHFPVAVGLFSGSRLILRIFLINQMTKKALENQYLSFSSEGRNDL